MKAIINNLEKQVQALDKEGLKLWNIYLKYKGNRQQYDKASDAYEKLELLDKVKQDLINNIDRLKQL